MKESTVDWLDRKVSWKEQCARQRIAEEKRNREKREEYERQFHNAEG